MIGNPKIFKKAIKGANKMQRELSKPKTRDWEKRFDEMFSWKDGSKLVDKKRGEVSDKLTSIQMRLVKSFIRSLLSAKELEVRKEGFIKGIELCEEVVKEALQNKEMAKNPDDPEIRAKWLLTEFDTYKSNSLSAKEVEVRSGIVSELKLWRPVFYKDKVTEKDIKTLLHSLTPQEEVKR